MADWEIGDANGDSDRHTTSGGGITQKSCAADAADRFRRHWTARHWRVGRRVGRNDGFYLRLTAQHCVYLMLIGNRMGDV